jgi:hypothetical protein
MSADQATMTPVVSQILIEIVHALPMYEHQTLRGANRAPGEASLFRSRKGDRLSN